MPPDIPEFSPLEEPVIYAPVLEKPERVPFWGYLDLAMVIGLLVASVAIILMVVGGLLFVYPGLKDNQGPLLLPTQFALYAFLYLSFRLVFGFKYGKPVFASLGWRRSHFNLAIAAAGGVLLAFLVSALAYLIHTPKVASPVESLMNSPALLAVFGVMAVTVAPLFEELLFRGFLQPLLSRTFGVAAGILMTAIVFGALHAPEYSYAWQYALAVSIVGAVLGWVRFTSNSIIPSTVMHGFYNAVFVIALAASKLKLIE
jgi:membrane protease YdiL (CAAX protease family)